MKTYRVTKYNPDQRDSQGTYITKDWTSISDIGKVFKDKRITIEDYLLVEDAYINTLQTFMNLTSSKTFNLAEVEYGENIDDIHAPSIYTTFQKNMLGNINLKSEFNEQETLEICRLILRENLWCKINSTNKKLIFEFGYDFYMYITAEIVFEVMKNEILNRFGLYLEVDWDL